MSNWPSLPPPVLPAATPPLAYHSGLQRHEVHPGRAFRGLIQAIATVSIIVAILQIIYTSMQWSQLSAFNQNNYVFRVSPYAQPTKPAFTAADIGLFVDILLPIVLIIGCIGLFLRQGWARIVVIVWAYLSIARLLWQVRTDISRTMSLGTFGTHPTPLFNLILTYMSASLVLPVMCLFLFHSRAIRSLFLRSRSSTAG